MTDVSVWPDATQLFFAGHSLHLAPEGIRHLRVGGSEIVQSLYPAVRRVDWSTVRARRSRERLDVGPGGIELCREDELDDLFYSRFTVSLDEAGRVEVTIELRARRDTEVNRWGLNICLEGLDYQGADVVARSAAGPVEGRLPVGVVVGGFFPPAARLDIRRRDGARVELVSEGLELEVEDQRNWTDPSFKVYSGSLADPLPITVRSGQVLKQRLRISGSSPAAVQGAVGTQVGGLVLGVQRPLLKVGVQVNDRRALAIAGIRDLIKAAWMDHARLDVELPAAADRPLPSQLTEFGVPIELAVLLPGTEDETLTRAVHDLPVLPEGSRVLIHQDDRRTTDRDVARRFEELLAQRKIAVEVTPGTDVYFTDLNRDQPSYAGGSLSFSLNPTVHRDEDEAVFATLAVQRLLVQQARSMFDADVVVSPLTLRPRGTPESAPRDRGARHVVAGADVDPRVRSLLGAAWTLGSIVAMVEAGATSATWLDLLGARGVVGDDGSRSPAYHLLAVLRASTRPFVRPVTGVDGGVVGLHLIVAGEGDRMVLGSLRPWSQTVDLGVAVGPEALRRRLRRQDTDACRAAGDWWSTTPAIGLRTSPTGERVLELEPFELTLLTWSA